MFTSDPNEKEWQRWQPTDFLSESVIPAKESTEDIPESVQENEQVQAELTHLRQQAEKNGFSQGRQRGLEEGKAQGYQDGFDQGRQEGIAQGIAESAAQQQAIVERFSQLLKEFTTSLSHLDCVIPSRLVQLSLTVARSVIGASIVCDHDAVLEKIRLLLQQETLLNGNVQLKVSPEDFAIVQDNLGEMLDSLHWTLSQDEAMLPGGCRVASENGELDATISARWEELCRFSREDCIS